MAEDQLEKCGSVAIAHTQYFSIYVDLEPYQDPIDMRDRLIGAINREVNRSSESLAQEGNRALAMAEELDALHQFMDDQGIEPGLVVERAWALKNTLEAEAEKNYRRLKSMYDQHIQDATALLDKMRIPAGPTVLSRIADLEPFVIAKQEALTEARNRATIAEGQAQTMRARIEQLETELRNLRSTQAIPE